MNDKRGYVRRQSQVIGVEPGRGAVTVTVADQGAAGAICDVLALFAGAEVYWYDWAKYMDDDDGLTYDDHEDEGP